MAGPYKSDQLLATSIAPNLPTDVGGRLRVDTFKYTLLGTEATTEVLELAKLPLGARVHAIRFNDGDLGTAFTADIGDKDLATRYLTAGNMDNTGLLYGISSASGAQVSILITTQNMRTIQATLVTVTAPTTGAVIQGRIEYVID